MSKKTTKITAVICTYNRYDLLPRAIESLCRQTLPQSEFDIIVVDNLPSSAEFSTFKAKWDGFRNIRYIGEPVAGLSSARNRGLVECRSELISFMDDDAVASPGWLAEIAAAFDLYGDAAGIVGGQVRPLWEVPRPEWLDDSMLGHLSVVNWGGDAPRVAGPNEWFAGTNISYRVDLLRQHGGFTIGLGRNGQTASLLGNEEIAATKAISEAGNLAIYVPAAIVDHLVPTGRLNQEWFRKRLAWQAVSDYLMQDSAAEAGVAGNWKGVVHYINNLRPEDRSLRGLFIPAEDKGQFRWQLGAIYDMTKTLLSKFDIPE